MSRMHTTTLRCRLTLPHGFRAADMLGFHGRDGQGVAERIEGTSLHKGLLWDDRPSRLTIRFGSALAEASLDVDGKVSADTAPLRAMLRRMLGLDQPVEAFERACRDHPLLGPLLATQAGLRVPVAPTPFEALSWAVTGQQISLGAAIAMRRRLIRAAGARHSSGLCCYPDAARVAALDHASLRAAGLSQAKSATLLALAGQITTGDLPLDEWTCTLPVDEIRASLLAVRGVGPWTVDYALLRGFGWLDGSLHGDVAVRRKLQLLLGREERMSPAETERWLAPFTPWRALVAAHLWAWPAGQPL